ncbi:MAG: HAMP domain-containing sensor histidine kinase [Sediminibacterium sp.]|nr:HAMP domain-containing sensor histidine kinase [Sediminibacterium sp.]
MISFIIKLWNAIANIGVTDELEFLEKKKTQVTNLVVALGLPLFLYFSIVNFLDTRYLLSSLNFTLFVGGIFILITQFRQKYQLARFIVIIVTTAIFTAQSILFRNGNELLLLVNIIVAIIYYTEKKFIVFITAANALCFFWIRYDAAFNPPMHDALSEARVLFNVGCALISFIVALQYFKFEQMAAQKAIEQKNAELEALNKTKEKLFSIIAHDLRSPIAQLKSTLDLVNRDYISKEEFHDLSHHFTKQIDQLQDNMNNLLTWSQSQLNGIITKPQAVNASIIIQEVIDLLKQQWQAKELQIQFQPFEETVWMDPDHLKLVVRNLLSNAIKFSNKKHTIVFNHSKNNTELTISIIDTGMGMPPAQMEMLYTSDAIQSTHGTDKERGTGLGLKLCKEFLDKNNGEIWAISELSIGSTFFFTVPLNK